MDSEAGRVELLAVTIPRELFDFLMGAGEIDGTSFGDLNAGLPGRFWWRALLQTAANSPTPDNGLREALERFASGEAFRCQRFAEDDDAEYFLRAQRGVQAAARSALQHNNGERNFRSAKELLIAEVEREDPAEAKRIRNIPPIISNQDMFWLAALRAIDVALSQAPR